MRRSVLLLAALASCYGLDRSTAGGEEPTFHDPSIVREGDAYYVSSTGPGILVRSSRDLETWEDVGPVFRRIPPAARKVVPDQPDLWAPDVARFGGVYHLYYAISRFGTNRSAIGHATSTTLDPRE